MGADITYMFIILYTMNECMNKLTHFIVITFQPELVSEQLSQMYLDLELEGLSKQLTLEEASSSSESSGDETKVKEKFCYHFFQPLIISNVQGID